MLTETQIAQYYENIAPRVVNYLIADGLSYPLACDIVQETFIRVWNKRNELSSKKSVSGFVFTVARNVRTDFFRKNKNIVFQDTIADTDIDHVSGQNTCDDDLKYLRKRLTQALHQLQDELRECYMLMHIGKNSIKDIAVIVNCPENLVRVRIHRAKEKLRELLNDLQDF